MTKVIIAACFFATTQILHAYDRVAVDFDHVTELAKEIATVGPSYQKPEIPAALQGLSYDDYRSIRFRRNEALWLGQDYKFIVEFFHPGYIYGDPVRVYETTDTHRQMIPFSHTFFNYEEANLMPGQIPSDIGFAGVRIRYPVNNPQVHDDLIVFQGASYFRALGRGHAYGLSARGLGYGIGENEESFPRFTQLWLKKPQADSEVMTIFALLEGENVVGAYEFTLKPGGPTNIDVRCRIWPLGDPSKIDFAPLTSMYFFGENSELPIDDWRPEVHDSDGLLIANGERWTWRPIDNPSTLSTQRFPVDDLRGFGLLQRDRRFTSYEDLESNYERRPSAWITPKGKWQEGDVVLVEIPTRTETIDNINAFWKPKTPPAKDGFYDLAYTLSWRTAEPNEKIASVIETRVGQKTLDEKATSFIVEFTPPSGITSQNVGELKIEFDANGAPVLTEPQLKFNEPENAVRVFFDLTRNATRSHALKLTLTRDGKPVSETWSYTWRPRAK
ncbi:MAG: glucan biosynthesis protein G [Puniceicoccales bacterium]